MAKEPAAVSTLVLPSLAAINECSDGQLADLYDRIARVIMGRVSMNPTAVKFLTARTKQLAMHFRVPGLPLV